MVLELPSAEVFRDECLWQAKREGRHRTNYKDTLLKTSALQYYFGVNIQDGMKWSVHINANTNKARHLASYGATTRSEADTVPIRRTRS